MTMLVTIVKILLDETELANEFNTHSNSGGSQRNTSHKFSSDTDAIKEPVIFIFDDTQRMDETSWLMLQ